MRRSVLALAALLSLAAAASQAQTLAAPIDQTVTVNLPAAAADVIIGNPKIIDVDLLNARQVIVTGKGYGVTSLQVFDEHGRSIYARQVVVSSVDENRVSFYRGANVANYACSPRCERTPMPGEAGAPAPAAATPPAPAP
jgi:hypothetical protein